MFSEQERQIFRFNDGEKERGVDPIATFRALLSTDGLDYEADEKLAATGNVQAIGRIIEAARKAFGLKPFTIDGDKMFGLTDMETLDLLQRFGAYVDTIQKKTETSPTSPAPSEPGSSVGV